MTKTAILGGSFDPVHLGHLYLLHNAVINTDYSRFILIPAKVSNFKRDCKPVSSDSDRLRMLELALDDYHDLYPQDNKEIIVSDSELIRGGVSYTYDTVIEMKKLYNISGRLGLIMGDDHIATLTKWYRFEDLKEEVEFIFCPRNRVDGVEKIPCDIAYSFMPVTETKEENATAVRNDVVRYGNYLSKRVSEYVREKKLYS